MPVIRVAQTKNLGRLIVAEVKWEVLIKTAYLTYAGNSKSILKNAEATLARKNGEQCRVAVSKMQQ